MEIIKKGFTNISYKDGNLFCQEKILNGFNHNVNYEQLNQFYFVPHFIKKDTKFVWWEFIENQKLELNASNLKTISQNLKLLHNSNCQFQNNFMLDRLKSFMNQIQQFNRMTNLILEAWKIVETIFINDKTPKVPIHNDLYFSNILVDKDNKLWFVDWEYAAMGNKYYDLALFTCATDLNFAQELILLFSYENIDLQVYYDQKLVAYFFILTWALSKEIIPINHQYFAQKLDEQLNLWKMTN
ncbi:phosphotransferase [Mycoplasmopsis gallinarum]